LKRLDRPRSARWRTTAQLRRVACTRGAASSGRVGGALRAMDCLPCAASLRDTTAPNSHQAPTPYQPPAHWAWSTLRATREVAPLHGGLTVAAGGCAARRGRGARHAAWGAHQRQAGHVSADSWWGRRPKSPTIRPRLCRTKYASDHCHDQLPSRPRMAIPESRRQWLRRDRYFPSGPRNTGWRQL